jgi:DNA replication protein DnaC
MQSADEFMHKLKERLDRDRAALWDKHGGSLPLDSFVRPKPCSQCKGAGWVKSREFDQMESTTVELEVCPKCGNRERTAETMRGRVVNSGMDHMRHVTFESTPAKDDWWWQAELWQAGLNYCVCPQGWFWMTGGYDKGKTTLAYCIGNEWLDSGARVIFRKVPTFLQELKATFDRDSEERYSDLMGAVLNAPCLILDDYGKQADTPWKDERLFEITDYRLERNLPTVVTTNLSMRALERRNLRLFLKVSHKDRVLMIPFPDDRSDEEDSA